MMPVPTLLVPDAFLMLATMIAWVHDLVSGTRPTGTEKSSRHTYAIAIWAAAISALGYAVLATQGHTRYFFSDMVVIDPFGLVIKACVSAGFACSLVYSKQYLEDRGLLNGPFVLLAMFSLLGQLVMVSGHHFLMLYLGLELMSLSLYAMIALKSSQPARSTEAAIKYYIPGALASGFLLYGISMLYGATGSLDLADVFHATAMAAGSAEGHMVLLFGLIFVVIGIAFKLGVVPFHMWVPDVYHGAPTAITMLTGGTPKLTALAWGWRILVMGLLPLVITWQKILLIFAVLSLIVGNLAGIVQKSLKRLLAYSAIANMGFVLLGLLSGVIDGYVQNAGRAYSAAMFYGVVYLFTALGSFAVLAMLSHRDLDVDNADDLKGLSKRDPVLAFVMLVMMFSLAGIPPAVGFYAKLAVIESAMHAGLFGLALLAVVMSVCGAFYYLRVVKLMYFDAPVKSEKSGAGARGASGARALLVVNGVAVLVFGIVPGPLMSLCTYAVAQTFI